MKPAAFTRHVPRTVDEVVQALAEYAPLDGRILAGGQSLVPIMAFRMARPAHLIDINEVEGLDRLAVDGDMLSIGARVRHGAFHKPVVDGVLGHLLAYVVKHIAHYPIRMRGTFCGSLAHADPASEWCLVAATLGAQLVVKSVRGERIVEVVNFLEGIMSTSLAEDEFLAEARLPLLPADTRFGFYEFNRRAGDFAMAAALVTYRIVDGVMADVRVGIGGAEDRARRIPEAEAALNGQKPDADVFAAAASIAAVAVDPLEDIQTSAEYRRDLVVAVTRRALDRSAQ
ncbi:FAD binding domain-containing protein [Rhodopseudomonas sp. P2A-2r]|uniref:FAD binding domain-containing protein n=1 Tax=unclassified Rhodopseudomonas TaxID=2638247 RepID=UPI0022344106|nr:FAD binding domain-containing protein [Rhodopseudomonas sp. P2A-2r]UZE47504.1 FAD binding domain-containing protein [Rhodopseudomonas sp. P2A-2r]